MFCGWLGGFIVYALIGSATFIHSLAVADQGGNLCILQSSSMQQIKKKYAIFFWNEWMCIIANQICGKYQIWPLICKKGKRTVLEIWSFLAWVQNIKTYGQWNKANSVPSTFLKWLLWGILVTKQMDFVTLWGLTQWFQDLKRCVSFTKTYFRTKSF